MADRLRFAILTAIGLVNINACGNNAAGNKDEVMFHRQGYGEYELYIVCWPVVIFFVSLLLSRKISRFLDSGISILLIYLCLNVLSYRVFSLSDKVNDYGMFLSSCLVILLFGLIANVIVTSMLYVSKKDTDIRRLLSESGVLVVVFVTCSWLNTIYKLGAGECIELGRSLTKNEIIASISERFVEVWVNTPHKGAEWEHGNLIKYGYQKFVEEYQAGRYVEAVDALPYENYSHDGDYHYVYDDFTWRVLRGTSYRLMSLKTEGLRMYGSRDRIKTYVVSNCGEVTTVIR